MSSIQQNEMQMLNEYVVALQRQIKSNQGERQILIQEVTRLEKNNSKGEMQRHQVKNQLMEVNLKLSRQNIEKINIENRVVILSDQNEKMKKQSELKEQKIKQLTNSVAQKTQLLAKQKNNYFLTNNYHSKQMVAMQGKLKQVQNSIKETQKKLNEEQEKLKESIQERNLLSCSLIACNQQLVIQKQENEKVRLKIGFCERYIKTLESKAKMLQKQATQTSDKKDTVSSSLEKTVDQLNRAKMEIQQLSLQLVNENKSNEESKRSYQAIINGLNYKYEQQITQLKEQIQQYKQSINQKNQSIESIKLSLDQQRVNYEKELQKNFQLTEQVSQLQRELERTKKQMTQEIQQKESIILNWQKQNYQLRVTQLETQQQLQKTLKKLIDVQNKLQRLKQDYQQKQKDLKILNQEYELNTKDSTAKQQQMIRQIIEMESQNGRLNLQLNQKQKQMEKKQQDSKQAIERIVAYHTNEMQQLSKKYDNQNKELQTNYTKKVNDLDAQLQTKLIQVKELQDELARQKKSSANLSTNQLTMKRTISMLQKQLEKSQQQVNSYHKEIFDFKNATDSTKEQLIEKEIKVISLTALIDKVNKDNQRLINQQSQLTDQVAALQSSTAYLKRQLTSTLDRQQTSLKEIRTLQHANKSFSRLISSSTSSRNLNAIGQRINHSRNYERHKSVVSIGAELRRFDSAKDFIAQTIEEDRVEIISPKKRQNNVIHKDSKQESSTSVDSQRMEAEDKNVIFDRESLVESQELIYSTFNNFNK